MLGLGSTLFLIVFYLLSCSLFLYLSSTLFLAFLVLIEHFMLFYTLSFFSMAIIFFKKFIGGCHRICTIHL